VVDDELSKADEGGKPSHTGRGRSFGELRHYVPADILNVSFPASVRGYDRKAVDAYAKRVNRVIAELKVGASPPAAVRHALEQAGQQVHGLLQSARETAEEITASARQEAEESTARAKAEAAELVVNASAEADRIGAEADALIANARTEGEDTVAKAKVAAEEIITNAHAEAQKALTRSRTEVDDRLRQLQEELASLRDQGEMQMRELEGDTEAVWKERQELLDDIRGMASGLVDLASAAAARFPGREPAGPQDATLEPEAEAETELLGVAADESTRAMQVMGAHDGGDADSTD
jgi:DivIVA domain-containing protein